MIYLLMHKGSGLGNQLHRYIAGRILSEKNGWDFSVVNSENFKGKSFMDLDMGKPNKFSFHIEEPAGKVVMEMPSPEVYLPLWEEWSKGCYDPDFNFVKDFTIVDGNFEDERYFIHRLADIKDWLHTEYLKVPKDVCVIGFRGGEFYSVPELGLPKEYYDRAVQKMLKTNPKMRFEVHTDDPVLAKQFFPDYPIIKDIGINWRSMRYAQNAIIANSSFYVLPRLMSGGFTIAPKYWNRYNTKKWDFPQNYYSSFMYI